MDSTICEKLQNTGERNLSKGRERCSIYMDRKAFYCYVSLSPIYLGSQYNPKWNLRELFCRYDKLILKLI